MLIDIEWTESYKEFEKELEEHLKWHLSWMYKAFPFFLLIIMYL